MAMWRQTKIFLISPSHQYLVPRLERPLPTSRITPEQSGYVCCHFKCPLSVAEPAGSSGACRPGHWLALAMPYGAGAPAHMAGRKQWWASAVRQGSWVGALLKCRCFWSTTYQRIQQKWMLILSSWFSAGSCATKRKVSSLRETSGGCAVLSSLLLGPKHHGGFFFQLYHTYYSLLCSHCASYTLPRETLQLFRKGGFKNAQTPAHGEARHHRSALCRQC